MFYSITILIFLALDLGFTPGPSLAFSKQITSFTNCQNEEIVTGITADQKIDEAYLEGFKNYPDALCRPKWINDTQIEFRFTIANFRRCGTTRVFGTATGSTLFYNDVTVISADQKFRFFAHCKLGATKVFENFLNTTLLRRKRTILPAGFREDENPVNLGEKIGKAPDPILRMVVKQDGRVIGQELTVQPGSPLTVDITLDSRSKEIYGILVSKMEVTDTLSQSETLLHNGCTVDPYLFENFLTENGDLTAKFRAFKFPESNYVQFIATVNVCLTSCEGLTCSNGQIGFGRRRREIARQSDFIIETSTILRVA